MNFAVNAYHPLHIVSGSVHPALAEAVAKYINATLGPIERRRFPNGEIYIRYQDSVRGSHVVIMQSLSSGNGFSVNDALIELLLMIDAARRASASEISVIMPYMAYSRQDRKASGREPISVAAVINMLQGAGATRLVSIDLHSPQTQAVFDGPFDHLIAEGVIRDALQKHIAQNTNNSYIMVSPDGGRAKIAEHYAEQLEIDVLHMPKTRDRKDSSQIKRPESIDGVKGKVCILIDDMIDTAGTLVSAANVLTNSGALEVIVAATHGLFSGPALERLAKSSISKLFITDAIPLDEAQYALGDKLTQLTLAPVIGKALNAIVRDDSVSSLFNGRNYL